jgi:hypothetical protein
MAMARVQEMLRVAYLQLFDFVFALVGFDFVAVVWLHLFE